MTSTSGLDMCQMGDPEISGMQDDFNGFLWNVVMLAMGGLALGEAVTSSGQSLSISRIQTHVYTSILSSECGLPAFPFQTMAFTELVSFGIPSSSPATVSDQPTGCAMSVYFRSAMRKVWLQALSLQQ